MKSPLHERFWAEFAEASRDRYYTYARDREKIVNFIGS